MYRELVLLTIPPQMQRKERILFHTKTRSFTREDELRSALLQNRISSF